MLVSEPVEERLVEPRWADDVPTFLDGLPRSLPPLHGFVRTTAKDGADVHLSTAGGVPLLASWRYGTGRVIASVAHGSPSWTREWLRPDLFNLLWSQSLRWAQQSAQAAGLDLTLREDRGALRIRVEALGTQGNPLNGLALSASVSGPHEFELRVPLIPIEGGVYEARLVEPPPGRYHIYVSEQARGFREQSREAVAGWYQVSYPRAYAYARHDSAQALDLVSSLGGRIAFEAADLQATRSLGLATSRSSAPWAVAGIVFLIVAMLVSRWGATVHAPRSERNTETMRSR